jgi:hypothetical protein
MRAFAVAWPDRAIMQQLAAQMPWAHNCVLLDREAQYFRIEPTLAFTEGCAKADLLRCGLQDGRLRIVDTRNCGPASGAL